MSSVCYGALHTMPARFRTVTRLTRACISTLNPQLSPAEGFRMCERGPWTTNWSPLRFCAWRKIVTWLSSKRSGTPSPDFPLALTRSSQHFCKEAVLWKNVSHPNILTLIAVDIDDRTKQCLMVSELMAKGNIFNFIQCNPVNRVRLVIDPWFYSHLNHNS